MKILICDDDLMFAQAVHDRLLEFCSRNGISASVIVHSSAAAQIRYCLSGYRYEANGWIYAGQEHP